MLWAAAIALFYHQWGKINGFSIHGQLDYVHANLEASATPIAQTSTSPPSGAAFSSAADINEKNILVSILNYIFIYIYI